MAGPNTGGRDRPGGDRPGGDRPDRASPPPTVGSGADPGGPLGADLPRPSSEGLTTGLRLGLLGVGAIVGVALVLLALVAVSGPSTLVEPPPAASFSWSYNETTDRVTVTMDSGEKMRAAALRFRGWSAVPERPLPDNLTWKSAGGGTGGSIVSEPAITAGDSVTLPAAGDYLVELVFWPSNSEPQRLAVDAGPAGLGLRCGSEATCERERSAAGPLSRE